LYHALIGSALGLQLKRDNPEKPWIRVKSAESIPQGLNRLRKKPGNRSLRG
jgi:hypothetical protein